MQRAMMGYVHVTVAVLSLLSVVQSAPVTSCESLIRQIEIQGIDKLLGKWMFIAESSNMAGYQLLTKMFVETAWSKVTAANESDAINVFQVQKMLGRCFTLTSKMTLENNTLSMVHHISISEVRLSSGCPDCLVFLINYTIGGNTYRSLEIISKRAKLTAAEMEEFMKQAECLHLPPPTILDPEKGFCPDETETTDLTDIYNDMSSDNMSQVMQFINSDGGIQRLLKLMSSALLN